MAISSSSSSSSRQWLNTEVADALRNVGSTYSQCQIQLGDLFNLFLRVSVEASRNNKNLSGENRERLKNQPQTKILTGGQIFSVCYDLSCSGDPWYPYFQFAVAYLKKPVVLGASRSHLDKANCQEIRDSGFKVIKYVRDESNEGVVTIDRVQERAWVFTVTTCEKSNTLAFTEISDLMFDAPVNTDEEIVETLNLQVRDNLSETNLARFRRPVDAFMQKVHEIDCSVCFYFQVLCNTTQKNLTSSDRSIILSYLTSDSLTPTSSFDCDAATTQPASSKKPLPVAISSSSSSSSSMPLVTLDTIQADSLQKIRLIYSVYQSQLENFSNCLLTVRHLIIHRPPRLGRAARRAIDAQINKLIKSEPKIKNLRHFEYVPDISGHGNPLRPNFDFLEASLKRQELGHSPTATKSQALRESGFKVIKYRGENYDELAVIDHVRERAWSLTISRRLTRSSLVFTEISATLFPNNTYPATSAEIRNDVDENEPGSVCESMRAFMQKVHETDCSPFLYFPAVRNTTQQNLLPALQSLIFTYLEPASSSFYCRAPAMKLASKSS